MWYCKYFRTKEAAKEYRKKHGGYICWEERTPVRKQLTSRGREWALAVQACGFPAEDAKYIVERHV